MWNLRSNRDHSSDNKINLYCFASDASSGSVDQMSFDILISRETLECYLSILLHSRRIVLQGPSGTGKTAFAMR